MYEKTKWKIQKMMKKGVFSGASFCFIEGEKEESNCWGLAQITHQRTINLGHAV